MPVRPVAVVGALPSARPAGSHHSLLRCPVAVAAGVDDGAQAGLPAERREHPPGVRGLVGRAVEVGHVGEDAVAAGRGARLAERRGLLGGAVPAGVSAVEVDPGPWVRGVQGTAGAGQGREARIPLCGGEAVRQGDRVRFQDDDDRPAAEPRGEVGDPPVVRVQARRTSSEAPPQSRSGIAYGTRTGVRPAAAAADVTPRTWPVTAPGLWAGNHTAAGCAAILDSISGRRGSSRWAPTQSRTWDRGWR